MFVCVFSKETFFSVGGFFDSWRILRFFRDALRKFVFFRCFLAKFVFFFLRAFDEISVFFLYTFFFWVLCQIFLFLLRSLSEFDFSATFWRNSCFFFPRSFVEICVFRSPWMKFMFFPRSLRKIHGGFVIFWRDSSYFSVLCRFSRLFLDPLMKFLFILQPFDEICGSSAILWGNSCFFLPAFWRNLHFFSFFFP